MIGISFSSASLFPNCLIWIAGIIVGAVTWRKHPQRSLLAIIAFGILLLTAIVLPIVVSEIFDSIVSTGVREYSTFLNILSIVEAIINISAWILILLAIFGGRQLGEEASVNQAPPAWPSQPQYYPQPSQNEQPVAPSETSEERVAGSEYIPPQD